MKARSSIYLDVFIKPMVRQPRRLFVLILCLILMALTQAAFLFLLKGFLKVIFLPNDSLVTLAALVPESAANFLQSFATIKVDYAFDRATLVVWVPTLLLLFGLVKAISSFGYSLNQQAMALNFGADFRERLFQTLLRLPWVEIRRIPAAQWMSRIMSDVLFLQTRIADILTCFVRGGVLVGACLIAMLIIHRPMGVLLIILAPIGAYFMGTTGRRIAWFAEKFQREMARMSAGILDIRSRFEPIRAHAAESLEFERFDRINSAYFNTMKRSVLMRSAFAPGLEFVGFFVFAGAMFAIRREWMGGDLNGETLVQFFAALGLLLKPLREIGEQSSRFAETLGVLNATVREIRQPAEPEFSRAHGNVPRLPESITMSTVIAGFDGKETIKAHNLVLKRGRTVAIVGHSGSGKSTLMRLLGGLVMPFKWQASVDWPDLVNNSAMVNQEPFLFNDTIRANLIYGLTPAQIEVMNDSMLWEALEAVDLKHLLRDRESGLDEVFLPTQHAFSGGQIQRLVVARVLLRNSAVWLFDEATSAVDAATEKDIIGRVTDLARRDHKVLLFVTHRLGWLESFDEVWFVDKGEVVLCGAPSLIKSDQRFRQFAQTSNDTIEVH